MELTIDFETYWDNDFNMKKLPTVQYVRDPRFSVHGCAIKIDANPTVWIDGDDLDEFFDDLPWDEITCIAHNALFDGLVLWEHYLHAPKTWVDTAGLVRSLLGPNTPVALGQIAPLLGLGAKGKDLIVTKGLRRLIQPLRIKLARYACKDADLTYDIYQLLYPHLPAVPKQMLHLATRWGTQAILTTDRDLLKQAQEEAQREQDTAIAASGLTATQLRSSKFFPQHLADLGIKVPTKLNAKGKTTWALARNDLEFQELQAEYPEHEHLWQGRLAAASTGPVGRLGTMLTITERTNTLPMPLLIYGAHTGRKSGTGGYNVQNFKRKSTARKAIRAPEGHVICVADSSQIELRMNMWYCGQDDLIQILADKNQDIYSHTASRHFHRPINKNDDPDERQFGKVIELGLGYYMGWQKFQRVAAVGFMGAPRIVLTDLEAQATVAGYRSTHYAVDAMWKALGSWLTAMLSPNCDITWKCTRFLHNEVRLPNGLSLQYPNLTITDDGQLMYETTRGWRFIHGGKLLENIIQALANIVIDEQTVAIDQHPDIDTVSSTHDEILGVAPKAKADECLHFMLETMSVAPAWAPDLPVFAEGDYAENYSK